MSVSADTGGCTGPLFPREGAPSVDTVGEAVWHPVSTPAPGVILGSFGRCKRPDTHPEFWVLDGGVRAPTESWGHLSSAVQAADALGDSPVSLGSVQGASPRAAGWFLGVPRGTTWKEERGPRGPTRRAERPADPVRSNEARGVRQKRTGSRRSFVQQSGAEGILAPCEGGDEATPPRPSPSKVAVARVDAAQHRLLALEKERHRSAGDDREGNGVCLWGRRGQDRVARRGAAISRRSSRARMLLGSRPVAG